MSEGWALAARVIGVTVGFPLLTWAFGSAVLDRFSRLDREERFVASFGVGFAAQALCAFGTFVLSGSHPQFEAQPLFNLCAVVLMVGFALWCRLTTKKRPAEDGPFLWALAALFALGYLHLVCIQGLLPVYRGSYWYYDWWMHYDEALVFVGDNPTTRTWAGYTLASRTPLLNLTTAFVMGLAGHGFETYQLAACLTNICFVLSLYLLLRDLFGRRVAWLALLLAPLNLWMLHNAWFTWPKMLAAYYLILALHFYIQWLRRRSADPAGASGYFLAFGIGSLLAYMTHQAVLFYVLPLLLHAAVMMALDWSSRPRLADVLAGLLLALAVGGTWYGWLAGTLGPDKIIHSTPVTVGNEKIPFRPASIARWTSFNLMASVVPIGIGQAFVTGLPPDEEPPPHSLEVYRDEKQWFVGPPDKIELHRGLTQLYFSLLTGAITLSLCAFLLVAGIRRLWRGPGLPVAKVEPARQGVGSALWLSLLGGTLGGALLHPNTIPWGIAHSAAFPTALVLTALAWGLLSRARRSVALVVSAGMVLEFLLMFWSHWWLLLHRPEVLEDLQGNAGYKYANGTIDSPQDVFFLNDLIGARADIFLVGAVIVQLVLIGLLFGFWQRRAAATEQVS